MRRLPLLLAVVFYFLFGGISFADASSLRRYYDWSATLEVKNQSVLGVKAFAQQTIPSSSSIVSPENFKQFDRYLLGGNLRPGNPFYFMKTFQEQAQLAFTFNNKSREALRLAMAGERLSEIQSLVSDNQIAALPQVAARYKEILETATNNIEELQKNKTNVKDLLAAVDNETAKHTIVLEKAAVRVPDAAKDAIENAIEASWNGIDTVAELSGKPAVPPDVVDRLQSLKAQGLLTGEEVGKLIAAKSRSEARTELKKYVVEGIVPEADFLRMNENVKQLYKDEFFKLHEMKRFYELQKLENQKPDDATLAKIQEFAKTYKPGEVVPADIRRFWAPVVRKEELDNSLAVHLIDDSLLKSRPQDFKKFQELVERYKPRPEDIVYVKTYIEKNKADVSQLPPEYQRMYSLAQKYGAQCGVGQRWVPVNTVSGGYCGQEGAALLGELPKVEDFAKGKACEGSIVSVKGPGSACSAYPSDCVPPGWSVTSTCVETPGNSQTADFAKKQTSCPSNAHFVPVSYDPSGGYCVPNYTPINNSQEGICPAGYHRSYEGGACLPDHAATSTSYSLTPLTATPGNYPNPLYPSYGQCAAGSHWVPEPISPRGGYCAPDTYTGGGGGTTSCTQPAGGCGFGTHWSQDRCSCVSDTAVECARISCASGQYFDNVSCTCRSQQDYPTSCTAPSGGCPSGWYWNASACSCNPSSGTTVPPSQCTPPSNGCPSGWTWVASACSCNLNSSTTTTGSYSTPTGSYNTPSGYGSCPSGQYWTGSYCATSSYQTPGVYNTPSYGTPTGSYTTPTGTYSTPSYGTPTGSYNTPPAYNTPTYETPTYNSPPPYGTPDNLPQPPQL